MNIVNSKTYEPPNSSSVKFVTSGYENLRTQFESLVFYWLNFSKSENAFGLFSTWKEFSWNKEK